MYIKYWASSRYHVSWWIVSISLILGFKVALRSTLSNFLNSDVELPKIKNSNLNFDFPFVPTSVNQFQTFKIHFWVHCLLFRILKFFKFWFFFLQSVIPKHVHQVLKNSDVGKKCMLQRVKTKFQSNCYSNSWLWGFESKLSRINELYVRDHEHSE